MGRAPIKRKAEPPAPRRRRASGKTRYKPVELQAMDDSELLAAVAGKTLQWRNTISGTIEEGRVPAKGKRPTELKINKDDRRYIVFNSVGSTMRACFVDAIVKVL